MSKNFSEEYFKNQLRTTWLGSEFIRYGETDSTNTRMKSIPFDDFIHGTVIQADHQKQGRGQYKKSWESENPENLMFSVGFRPPSADRLPLLTLACAHAVKNALARYTDDKLYLKWPNDIMCRDKKIGGVLTECLFIGKNPDRVVVGIGLNLGDNWFSGELSDIAISLSDVTDQLPEREKLLAEILTGIELAYQKWHKQDVSLHQDISRTLIGYGEWVELSLDGEMLDGNYKFLGINEKGEFLVLDEVLDVKRFTHEQIRVVVDY